MASKVLRRRDPAPGAGLQAVLAAQANAGQQPVPIPSPPETVRYTYSCPAPFLPLPPFLLPGPFTRWPETTKMTHPPRRRTC